MTEREPETAAGQRLRAQVSAERWARVVAEADRRAEVMDAVATHKAHSGDSWRRSVAAAAPVVPWPTFVRYKRRYEAGKGEAWERLLDQRVPPDRSIAEQIRGAACLLRGMERSINPEAARSHLVAQFGIEGEVSDTWLKRVWSEAGVTHVRGGGDHSEVADEVEDFHGGGGLALLAAAEVELGAMKKLAANALESGKQRAELQEAVELGAGWVDDAEGRDEQGQFTAEYNARHRTSVPPGEADERWASDEAKAARRKLSKLATLSSRPETLVAKMLAMGVSPLLTERRGFDGLDGPAGAWLGVLGSVAYMPATLDKTLSELGLLDVAEGMWQTHAKTWCEVSQRWSAPGPDWLQTVAYIDGTADPYWTRRFAKSGKVSRVGRVMPCMSRIALNSSAGIPLLVETHAGTVSLRDRLLPMLTRLDEAIGPGAEVGRLTVIDSEAGTAGMLWAMHDQTEMTFITVLKGRVLAGATLHSEGPWQPFRKRDQLREVEVDLHGKGAPLQGITVRGVQMRRVGGRNPQTTLFVTNGHANSLSTEQVATRYLARWPLQEQLFRTARNGGGLERSHGYGGGYVTHVALDGKLERAQRALANAEKKHTRALASRERLAKDLGVAPTTARNEALALADKAIRAAQKLRSRKQADLTRLETMPDRIYVRDTGRDSIMTCLKLGTLSLIEFALQEYFGGVAMQWRTFIEQFVALPATVRTRSGRRLYQIHANPRQPERMAQLAVAIAEINRRKLRAGDELLVFELIGLQETGS